MATGPFQTPYVPELGTRLGPDVFQAHSTGYRSPGALPEGTALVVGGGNTGYQIAKELRRHMSPPLRGLASEAAPSAAARP